jgi:hypothetical protein
MNTAELTPYKTSIGKISQLLEKGKYGIACQELQNTRIDESCGAGDHIIV